MNFIQSFMSALAVWALKGAYISTFFAMSSALSRASVRSLYGVTIFAGFSFVASLLLHSLWCRPISANW